MRELANCAVCDVVFVRTSRSMCRNCYHKEKTALNVVLQFLSKRENKEAQMTKIVDATGVSFELLGKFVKEGRLRSTDFPNLSYPCEKCGTGITTGRLCVACANAIKEELSRYKSIEQLHQRRSENKQERQHVYYMVNNYKK